MLRPVMLFRVSIIILLLWASVPSFAEAARLTFGAAPGATRDLDSESQARRLASDLAEALDDDVSVRLFDDQLQLGQWLNQFAMVDLGVMDAAFLAAHPGEFLVLGSVEQEGQLFVVARQGATGDFPRRVAAALRRGGGIPAPSPVKPPAAAIAPPESAGRPPVPGMAVSAAPLVLGLVAGREGVIHNPAQAEQLAAQLGKWLDVPVRVRLFDNEQVLADWFCRFRMIDLAVIDEPSRRDPLVGDYRPLQRLTAAGGAKGLLVARRDLPEARLRGAVQALDAFGREPNLGEILASPVAEPPGVAATPTPTPIRPVPPQPPAWPEAPVVSPAPEPAAMPPVPEVPPMPEFPAEPPAPPEVAEPEMVPAPSVMPPPLSPVESFQLPAAVGPVGVAVEAPEMLPESAAPVVPETVPETIPEVPFIPVTPHVIEEVPPPAAVQEAATAPEITAAVAAEPPAAAVAETPVPVSPIMPAPAPSETVVAESVPETIPELPFAPVPPRGIAEGTPPVAGEEVAVAEEPLPALAGTDEVPDVIAQPDLPQELRPPGVPLPRPGRLPKASPPAEEPLLLEKLQEQPMGRTPKPAPLLPAPDPEPGIVYVAPFITLMVPTEVRERIFDQFIDAMNQQGAALKLKFVILKQGIDKIDHSWLEARKHVLGEIYGYVEDSGCCSTDLRTRVRLTYFRAHQPEPVLKFEYPVRIFFDHDRSTLIVERQKLADQIAGVLVDELLKALQP